MGNYNIEKTEIQNGQSVKVTYSLNDIAHNRANYTGGNPNSSYYFTLPTYNFKADDDPPPDNRYSYDYWLKPTAHFGNAWGHVPVFTDDRFIYVDDKQQRTSLKFATKASSPLPNWSNINSSYCWDKENTSSEDIYYYVSYDTTTESIVIKDSSNTVVKSTVTKCHSVLVGIVAAGGDGSKGDPNGFMNFGHGGGGGGSGGFAYVAADLKKVTLTIYLGAKGGPSYIACSGGNVYVDCGELGKTGASGGSGVNEGGAGGGAARNSQGDSLSVGKICDGFCLLATFSGFQGGSGGNTSDGDPTVSTTANPSIKFYDTWGIWASRGGTEPTQPNTDNTYGNGGSGAASAIYWGGRGGEDGGAAGGGSRGSGGGGSSEDYAAGSGGGSYTWIYWENL